ncbi:transglutaminase-like cysteine peptidase [Agrobacterium tumefaciens]|nr:transglutaminase-like cysteine peptidase [Agrobacterium tumefaciens]
MWHWKQQELSAASGRSASKSKYGTKDRDMKKISIVSVVVGAAAVLSASMPAYALNLGNMSGRIRAAVETPAQYVAFCKSNPTECRSSSVSVAADTPALRGLLSTVNSAVNSSMRATRDSDDVWSVNGSKGDCEDFALTKRSRLIRAGVPAGSLRMAVVITKEGTGHAVLLVKTNKGDLVLDNLRKTIVSKERTGYAFIKVASANPLRWVR